MAEGEWTGTMNLTEPHCGTDLGLLKTKAVNKGNGTYEITGQKIFISCGEHDLSDNIIHLVLARIEGAPDGVKGISLFVVPKILVDFERNKVSCGSIEKKMGIHGSSTCVMNYDGAMGFLIGEENKGLNAMFVMMNEARLGVAVQGLSQSELAYQNAVKYAIERLQGRSLTGVKNEQGPADPIIVHPDVRRMLLDIKSVNIPGRLLIYKAALLCEEKDDQSQDILGLMTPILKGVLTDYGFENAVKAQQIFGGHGYIKEWGMEQIVRDARIAQIYEGANGVQALDLVGRKLPKNMGKAVRTQFKLFEEQLEVDLNNENVNKWAYFVDRAYQDLKKATQWLVQNGIKNPDNAGSASYDYMKLFGLVYMGFAWLDIIKVAKEKNMEDKLIVADYFVNRILPETSLLWHRIEEGSKSMMSLPVDKF
jgi:alkylation response protein AidB-like acyl-CoA dehydrogenase